MLHRAYRQHRPDGDVTSDVRYASEADMATIPHDVRFAPKSGHSAGRLACPLSAKSGHSRFAWPFNSGRVAPAGRAIVLGRVVEVKSRRKTVLRLGLVLSRKKRIHNRTH